MFVEDDPILLHMYIRTFQEEADRKILIAADGQQAIELIDRVQPDLLITGIHMPKADGFMLLEHIRRKGYDFPTIVVSNLSGEDFRKRAFELGAKEFYAKADMTMTMLKPTIEKHLLPFTLSPSPDAPTSPHHGQRAMIEINMIHEEAVRLWPFLTEEEKREKQREYAVRTGVILKREIQIIKEECDAMDAQV